jgi:GT2 family glycosyltransferase
VELNHLHSTTDTVLNIAQPKVSCDAHTAMGGPFRPTIIIPTKDRCESLFRLVESIRQLAGLDRILPEVIVADNNSRDGTYEIVEATVRHFPTTIRVLRVLRAGKSAAINDAVRIATGDVFAFLDDDVIVDKTWLTSVEEYFRSGECQVAQGTVRLHSPDGDDPEVQRLNQRYRTIPMIDYPPSLQEVRSLNGSNFFARRGVFDRVGGFDERLGPGASGTSEDVEFANRLARGGLGIGYAPKALVYHHVDRNRLTDEYFERWHRHQGRSRLLMRDRGQAHIRFDLLRAYTQYVYYFLRGKERKQYKSKGRIYHYLAMIDAKRGKADRWTGH